MWMSPLLSNVVNNYVGETSIHHSKDFFKGS